MVTGRGSASMRATSSSRKNGLPPALSTAAGGRSLIPRQGMRVKPAHQIAPDNRLIRTAISVLSPIESWKELLNPEFKGKAAILNIPSIGIMDAAMVVEAAGIYKYPDKGNMTKAEIDATIEAVERVLGD